MAKDEIPIQWNLGVHPRYVKIDMGRAMKGKIERGLVELIRNSDDSYRDLEEQNIKVAGKIRIEIERRKKGPSLVIVRDRAMGMSREELYYKLGGLGKRTSKFREGKARHGLFGRGGRDVVAFGTVHYESIKDGEYNEMVISPSLKCCFVNSSPVRIDEDIRKKLGIPKGNGTVVTIEVGSQFPIPHHETLVRDFSRYYSLRDVFSNPDRDVVLVDLIRDREDRLSYTYPEGNIVTDEWFQVPNYPEAKAHLVIRQHSTPFERDYSPCREGILVKSAAAIHQCTYFGLETEPLAWKFSGELYCEFIDKLIREYDDREDKNPDCPGHPQNNPMRLLDPNRDGLILEHPFTESLYRSCRDILKRFVEKLKSSEIVQEKSVTDRELDRKMRELAKEISKPFEQDLKALEEEIPPGPELPPFVGLRIIPSGDQPIPVVVDEPKTFSVEVRTYEPLDESLPVNLESIDARIRINSLQVYLKKFSEDRKVGRTTFTIESNELGAEGSIEAQYNGYSGSVYVRVVHPSPTRELSYGLSFDKPVYHLVINKDKALTLWLKRDAKEAGDSVTAKISSRNPEIVVKRGGECALRKTDIPGVLCGKCKIMGRQLKAKGDIIAQVEGFEPAQTRAIVEERDTEGSMRFKPPSPVEKDFSPLRYKWDNEDKPQLLEIGAKHPSIRKYLGEPVDGEYPNLSSPLYHAVLAEVVAEALAFCLLKKCFRREGERGRLDYDSAALYYHRYFSKYLAIAHKILVPL